MSADQPVATLSVKLQDVAPDGTSVLVSRGVLNLTRRGGMAAVEPLVPGRSYDVEVEIEAAAYRWLPGHVLRLAVAGADWPNTSAPPQPVTLTVHGGRLVLPAYDAAGALEPSAFVPGDETSSESDHGVVWRVERDVLGRRTTCVIDHGSAYDAPYGSVVEHYGGRVSVSSRTFEQTAASDVSFTASFADDGTGEPVTGDDALGDRGARRPERTYDVRIAMMCSEGDRVVAERRWERQFPRDLA